MTEEVKFLDGTTLVCPGCCETYLHHGEIKIFNRTEDHVETTLTRVGDGTVSSHVVPSEGLDNPSSRRDGVVMSFWCELCSTVADLTIAQHKGQTVVRWRIDAVATESRKKNDHLR